MKRASIDKHDPRHEHDRKAEAPARSTLKHRHVLDEFSVATLNVKFTPAEQMHELEASAASEQITYHEWLHHRAISRLGITNNEPSEGAFDAVADVRPRPPLFKLTLGNGGNWDW